MEKPMRTDATRPISRGLSCYTENLAGYLAARAPARADLTARSVRLAVDPATGRFSHHDRALNNLPDGRRLAYRGAPDAEAALTGIAVELAGHARVLAVADSGALPWLSGAADAHAPHLILVDGRTPDGGWHVVDGFTALFSGGGHQEPFAGELSGAELTALLAFPRGLSEVHRARNALAFGFPVPTPAQETYQWLAEEQGTTAEHLPGEPWLTGAGALEETARLVLADLRDDGERGVLEDVWAAAQHHIFRDAHLLTADGALSPEERRAVDATTAKWRELPRLLRFAANSARRGRPRPSLVTSAFTALAELEAAASPLHAAHGYGVPTALTDVSSHAGQGS
ncbi:hypothetical protein SCAB_0741 [Streptomyces scabiei 87.22]|uniref:Uncharacterized protein n=1 Tax=Streptomyces scabiei (strain 87.22) TaxID=680198 RepID=C9ZCS2_STRSW|nr:hypothetical protein SCAB_0741 [Streptomyces scabiei 87.22]